MLRGLLVALSACVIVACGPGLAAAQAATFTADPSIADGTSSSNCSTSPCTLRQALADAETTPGASTIVLEPGTYALTQGELDYDAGSYSVTLQGSGSTAGSTEINGEASSGVLEIDSGTVTLDDLEIAQGASSGDGGAIDVGDGATVNVNDDLFEENTAQNGGAIYDNGTLTIDDSALGNNSATESGTGDGGAVYYGVDARNDTVTNSTFAYNTAVNEGGALFNLGDDTPSVQNSTLADNSTSETGAGLGGGDWELGGTILDDAVFSDTGECSGSNSIHPDDGYNIENSNNCGLVATGDHTSTNPELEGNEEGNGQFDVQVAAFGGLTPTVPLQAGSPAIGVVPAVDCPTYDQRGAARLPAGATFCDVGAYQSGTNTPAITTGSAATVGPTDENVGGTVSGNGYAAVYMFEFTPDSDYSPDSYANSTAIYDAPTLGGPATAVAATLTGLSPDTTYDYRIEAVNDAGTSYGANEQFTTAASSGGGGGSTTPEAVTGGTEGVTDQSATILGTVEPAGQSCTYQFFWGTTVSYGSSSTVQPAGSTDVFSAGHDLSGLTGGTEYDYRIDATCGGTTYDGANMTFTTLGPTIATGTSGSVTQTSATVFGRINSNASGVTYYFNYGTTTAYGSQSPTQDAICINCAEGANAIGALTALTPGTTYHYQLVATNSTGTSYGADQTFTTQAPPPTIYGDNALNVTSSGAEITGSATTSGVSGATEKVIYAPNSSYNASATNPYSGGSATSAAAVPASGVITIPVGGLIGNTPYDYAVVITDSSGTTTSTNQQFTTAPNGPVTATVGAATKVSATGAVLNGAINDQNQVMTVAFSYTISATSCSGTPVTQSGAVLANGSAAVSVPASNSTQQIVSQPVSLTGYAGLGLGDVTISYSMSWDTTLGEEPEASGNSSSTTVDIPQLPVSTTPFVDVLSATSAELDADVGTFPSDATASQSESGIFEVGTSLPLIAVDSVSISGTQLNSACAEPISALDSYLEPDTTYYYGLAEVVDNYPGWFGGYGPNLQDPTDVFSTPQTFTTPATNPPGSTSVSSNGSGTTTLGCASSLFPCVGSYGLYGDVGNFNLSGLSRGAKKTASGTLTMLAKVHFTIPAGKQKKLHFHLTAAGKKFLKRHKHAALVAKVTSKAGHGKKVTTTSVVHLTKP